MAQPRYRHFPLFVATRKFAECNGIAYNLESGDEIQYDAEGVAGASDGIPGYRIEADYIVPVSGTKIDVMKLFVNKTEFTVKILVGGKAHQFPARITAANLTSQSKTGVATGKITITAVGNLTVS